MATVRYYFSGLRQAAWLKCRGFRGMLVQMKWDDVVEVVGDLRLEVRVKCRGLELPGRWTSFLIVPVPGYLESSPCGPVPFPDVEWIDVNPLRITERGRLVTPLIEDMSAELQSRIAALGVESIVESDSVRIPARATNP